MWQHRLLQSTKPGDRAWRLSPHDCVSVAAQETENKELRTFNTKLITNG